MEDLETELKKIRLASKDEFSKVSDLASLEIVRQKFLSSKGIIAKQYRALSNLEAKDKASFGKTINSLRAELQDEHKNLEQSLKQNLYQQSIANEKEDLTLPAREKPLGKYHVISQTTMDLTKIFGKMGFEIATGPEIENDFHNFTALNFPKDHPAKEMHDTFFLEKKDDHGQDLLLRTHTSTVQIRSMIKRGAPISIIAPGRCYRCDSDTTHTPMFHQIEGLHIDKKVSMADLMACVNQFAKDFFEVDDLALRFRSSFFPFTEPSAEVDIGCKISSDQIKLCRDPQAGLTNIKHNKTTPNKAKDKPKSKDSLDWLEILGCGMVHPNVLKNCNIDPDVYSGFAFGMGIERIAMLKYGIPDLRTFFKSDIRWLKHYGFNQYS